MLLFGEDGVIGLEAIFGKSRFIANKKILVRSARLESRGVGIGGRYP